MPVITGKNNKKSGFEIIKNGVSIFLLLFNFFFALKNLSGFWNTLKTYKISKRYAVICKCQSIFINLTKHWNIWCIAKGGWVGFYCFLTNIFQITFKYLQNIGSFIKKQTSGTSSDNKWQRMTTSENGTVHFKE